MATPDGAAVGDGVRAPANKDAEAVLNTARADRPMWLLKVPLFVAEDWFGVPRRAGQARPGQAQRGSGLLPLGGAPGAGPKPGGEEGKTAALAAEGEVIGKVRMAYDPREEKSEGGAGLPGEAEAAQVSIFPLDYMKNHLPMHVFSEPQAAAPPPTSIKAGMAPRLGASSAPADLALEGKVEFKFDMRPGNTENDSYYQQLVKRRGLLSNTPRLITRAAESEAELPAVQATPPTQQSSLAQTFFQAKRKPGMGLVKAQGQEAKRVRTTREALESRLFKLFEQQPTYNLRQLIDATQQPSQFLKEVLKDLCMFHKGGQLQGQYELKPEYRAQHKQGDPPGDGDGGGKAAETNDEEDDGFASYD